MGTRELIELLTKLDRDMTPGPWWYDADGYCHSTPVGKEYVRIERTIPDDAPDEAYDALPEPCVCSTRRLPKQRDNGEAIVALRNALPAIIAALAPQPRPDVREKVGAIVGLIDGLLVTGADSFVQEQIRKILEGQ